MTKQQTIVILAIVIGVAAALQGFVYWKNAQEEARVSQGIDALCGEFEVAEGEVSCREAVDFALKEYAGEVVSVEKREVQVARAGEGASQPVVQEHIAWVVAVAGDAGRAEVVVGVQDKELLAIFTGSEVAPPPDGFSQPPEEPAFLQAPLDIPDPSEFPEEINSRQ